MDRIYLNNLFDCYESLLTEKERQYFKDYYADDLSLAEIALNYNVSRSAVQKSLKKIQEKLEQYENNLEVFALRSKLAGLS